MKNKKYIIVDFYSGKESRPMPLSEILQPYTFSSKKVEKIKENSETIGRLAALMVNKGLITLDEALAACGSTDKVIEVEL